MIVRHAMESVLQIAILLACFLAIASVFAQDEPIQPLPMAENPDKQKVALMGLYQLGRRIPEADLKAILAFLHSLEGTHPAMDSSL